MKLTLLGGFCALTGSVWSVGILLISALTPLSGWTTPPGRLLSAVGELGLTPLLALSGGLTLLGLCLMVIALFKKGQGNTAS